MAEDMVKSIIEGKKGEEEVLEGDEALAELMSEYGNLILRGDKLKDSFNLAATRAESSGNAAMVPILRAIANELVPLLQDTIDVSRYSFAAVVGLDSEEEEAEEGESEEDEGGAISNTAAEAIYRVVRLTRSFLEGLMLSGLLAKKPKAKAAADNLLAMLKGLELQGAADGFLPDSQETKMLGDVKDSFK